mgnify:CR=1 FL=1
MDFEALRASYRPEHVRILFLGESVPAGGMFFYSGNSNLVRHTCEAFAAVFGTPRDAHAFPQVFRDRGCHLVDLCNAPVNGLDRVARRKARNAGIPALARNLWELRPECVVVVGKAIESYCQKAVKTGGGGWHPCFCFAFSRFRQAAGICSRALRALAPAAVRVRTKRHLVRCPAQGSSIHQPALRQAQRPARHSETRALPPTAWRRPR